LQRISSLFHDVYDLGFNLIKTPIYKEHEAVQDSSISGKQLVFTGSMQRHRDIMQAEAKKLGAKIGSTITGKTDFLIFGSKVGQAKLTAAKSKGIAILTEEQYLLMIKS